MASYREPGQPLQVVDRPRIGTEPLAPLADQPDRNPAEVGAVPIPSLAQLASDGLLIRQRLVESSQCLHVGALTLDDVEAGVRAVRSQLSALRIV